MRYILIEGLNRTTTVDGIDRLAEVVRVTFGAAAEIYWGPTAGVVRVAGHDVAEYRALGAPASPGLVHGRASEQIRRAWDSPTVVES